MSKFPLEQCPDLSVQLCRVIWYCYLPHQIFTTNCLKTIIPLRVEKMKCS